MRMRKNVVLPLLALCLLLPACGVYTVGNPLDSGTQINPATLSAKDLRLVATKTYNRLFDYHVAKSQMANLTAEEKRALNELKTALEEVYGPLTEFQLLVDADMVVSPSLRDKILLFLDHWLYKQMG